MSQSQGTQLSVTKKSNVLDKPKPNILNSKKAPGNHDQSNNNSVDNNDSGPTRYESASYQAPAAAVPEVTVSGMKSPPKRLTNREHLEF